MDGKNIGLCDVYYSCHAKERKFGVGIVVGERLCRQLLSFTSVDLRLAVIRIKAEFFNISLICAHAPMEEKADATKDSFFDHLESSYERCPRNDVKIVLDDFNARVGKEGLFGPTVGKFSLHNETSGNGRTAAEEEIRFRRVQKISWYDEECHAAAERKDATYRATLRSGATRAMWDRYWELRKEERCITRKKNERPKYVDECEELKMQGNRKNARKFYQKVWRLAEGFKTAAFSCKNKDGDLVTDTQSVLKLWRKHFLNLLNSDNRTCHRKCEDPDTPIDGTAQAILTEFKIARQSFLSRSNVSWTY